MKYITPSQFADPAVAARKEGGTPEEYGAGLAHTIAKGWLWKHESGTYVKFMPAGAELFA